MNNERHDIDALLRRNVERQLADFDWQGLRRGIDGRVTSDTVRPTSWFPRGEWVAMAAGVALAAGILVLAMIHTVGPGGPTVGTAQVTVIETAQPAGTAQVSFPRAESSARCEVTILTTDKPQEKSPTQTSWCIIAKQGFSTGEHPDGRDASDVLCLF